MPFVAAAKKPAETSAFPKPAAPIKLASAAKQAEANPVAKPAAEPAAAAAAAPSMIGPPKPASKKNAAAAKAEKSEETSTGRPSYVDRDLLEFPLFMDKLPTERSKNADIAALQDLAAEETPEERAENFKNSGNECLQHGAAKWWDDAIEYYTRAIQCGSRDLPKVSVYFSNRAAVQILKKNWGHCARDCLEALKLDPGNVKAMYRASKAYYELRKLPEALKYLRLAMAKAKTAQLVELERDIARRMRKERLKEEKRAKELEEVLEKDLELTTLLRERGYRIGSDDVYEVQSRVDQYQCKWKTEKSEGRDGKQVTEVSMPVLIVYPQSRTSDFVQSWNETFFVRDILEMLFKETKNGGRDWDVGQLYTLKELSNMCVYLKTNDVFDTYDKQEWVRVKLSATVQEAVTADSRYVIPVIPVFYVFHSSWKDTFFGKEVQEMYGVPARRPS
jgi:tetratricopeptide (TPR) repeat protein